MPHLILVLSALIWGATYPSTKAVLAQLTPFSFMFVRFFLGCLLVVVAVLVLRRRIRHDPATLRMSFIATVFLFLGFALQPKGWSRRRPPSPPSSPCNMSSWSRSSCAGSAGARGRRRGFPWPACGCWWTRRGR